MSDRLGDFDECVTQRLLERVRENVNEASRLLLAVPPSPKQKSAIYDANNKLRMINADLDMVLGPIPREEPEPDYVHVDDD